MILTSTRDHSVQVPFTRAVHTTVPSGGGLFTPQVLPKLSNIDALLQQHWQERNVLILHALIGDEYTKGELETLVTRAFDFPLPLVAIDDASYSLELWHGPTLAFKDFGIRFLAALLELDAERSMSDRPTTILCATSGDTGAAVANAFWQRPHFRVVVLYPAGRVTPLQERQFAALGENVLALKVDGSFDDCQRLAKACFADEILVPQTNLTSANSLNIARVVAQTLYYFEALAQLRARGDTRPALVAVPSGNFGNALSGLMARAMGLPLSQLVIATNANNTVPHFLATGEYMERASVRTMSNAMDVGAPSNWERIHHMFSGDHAAMRAAMLSGSASDADTRATLVQLRSRGCVADPHTAVGIHVLHQHLNAHQAGISLSTAHPAKFTEVLDPVFNEAIALPPALLALSTRPLLSEAISNDATAVKQRVRLHVSAEP